MKTTTNHGTKIEITEPTNIPPGLPKCPNCGWHHPEDDRCHGAIKETVIMTSGGESEYRSIAADPAAASSDTPETDAAWNNLNPRFLCCKLERERNALRVALIQMTNLAAAHVPCKKGCECSIQMWIAEARSLLQNH